MLHWLPVQQRIDYKVALLTFKVHSTLMPWYLCHLIQDQEHGRNLQSTTTMLCQPFMTTTFAKPAFRCSALAVWNSLPKTVLNSDSVAVFKSSFPRFSLLPLLTNMLPGSSASEVTTLRRYTNVFIIIIIISSSSSWLSFQCILRTFCTSFWVHVKHTLYHVALSAVTVVKGLSNWWW